MSLTLPKKGSGFLLGLARNRFSHGRTSGGGTRSALAALLHLLVLQLGGALVLQSEKWDNPAAADIDGWLTAKATTTLAQEHDADGALAGTTLSEARNVSVTLTSTDDQYNFPVTVTVTGKYKGVAQVEEVVIASTDSPGTVQGAKPFDQVTSVAITANADTGGSVAVGTGTGLAAAIPPQARYAVYPIYKEIVSGTGVVTTGTINAYGVYFPASAPNGTLDYFIAYEGQIYDFTVG